MDIGVGPQPQPPLCLLMLSHLMVMLMDEEFCQKLLDADRVEQFLSLTDTQKWVKFPDEAPAEPQKPDGSLRVLAITARPTGITHTYMAAGALGYASPAPHGGLFVFPVIRTAAILIGSVAGMLMLGLPKKKKA